MTTTPATGWTRREAGEFWHYFNPAYNRHYPDRALCQLVEWPEDGETLARLQPHEYRNACPVCNRLLHEWWTRAGEARRKRNGAGRGVQMSLFGRNY